MNYHSVFGNEKHVFWYVVVGMFEKIHVPYFCYITSPLPSKDTDRSLKTIDTYFSQLQSCIRGSFIFNETGHVLLVPICIKRYMSFLVQKLVNKYSSKEIYLKQLARNAI